MAGSVLSESKTNNLVAFSRSGCFGLNSNRPLNVLTIEETTEFKAIDALPQLTKTATSLGPSKASRPPAAKNAGSNYT